MRAFFASVDLFDPTGSERMRKGKVYGGETRLFVLAAASFDAALRKLCIAIVEEGARLDRVHKAAPVAMFTTEDFPFHVDIDAMVKDAIDLGEICVTPDYTFSPYGNNETGLFYGLFELFKPDRDAPNDGQFTYAACSAPSCGDALSAVLDDVAGDNCILKSVEDFSDAGFYDPAIRFGSGSLSDLIGSETDGVVWAGQSFFYSEED